MAYDGQDRRGARTRESSGTMNRFVSFDAASRARTPSRRSRSLTG